MNQMHLLTIVVPVYNRAHLVVRTLDSIAASTYNKFSLVIVDNSSTDDTFCVCQQWKEQHQSSCISIELIQEHKAGAAAARNCGLAMCQTPYVYFFDSDDSFSHDFISDITEYLSSVREEPDMVFIPIHQETHGKLRTRPYSAKTSAHIHILNSMLNTPSMLFRTEWLRTIGGWNEQARIWDDWELGVRALTAGTNVAWLTKKSYHHIYIHPQSITGNDFSSRIDEIMVTMGLALEDVVHEPINHKALSALYARAMIWSGKLHKEGDKASAERLQKWASQNIKVNWFMHTAIAILRFYTKTGGRGAWRLAIAII